MRTRWIVLAFAALLLGAFGGALLSPPPARGVSREIIQLQQQVAQLLDGQRELRSALDTKSAELKTLLEQSLDSVSRLSTSMGGLQKSVQDVQANSGARIDSLSTQVQSISDNLQDVQARVGKLSQQMTDMQGILQSIDAKVPGGVAHAAAGSSAAPGPGQPTASGPPISADVLYTNALRDFTSGKYDLSRQEFSDYLQNFPSTDLAGNAQFYLGEIAYAQGNYQDAIAAYDKVIVNHPKSFKAAAATLKKGQALLVSGQKASATREFREVIRRFPGTNEARRAQVKLHQLGAHSAPPQ